MHGQTNLKQELYFLFLLMLQTPLLSCPLVLTTSLCTVPLLHSCNLCFINNEYPVGLMIIFSSGSYTSKNLAGSSDEESFAPAAETPSCFLVHNTGRLCKKGSKPFLASCRLFLVKRMFQTKRPYIPTYQSIVSLVHGYTIPHKFIYMLIRQNSGSSYVYQLLWGTGCNHHVPLHCSCRHRKYFEAFK